MRILKVELQNINSLKSDTPIVIDFESDKFQDVGLYAITGSTGAGKTTILDAITIALYHEVPRFNKSNIKAGLEDVVSYGADVAMARVTFANKKERFEVQWSMRLTTKSGKRLENPKEEVRLKNLSTSKIIAEKKREVQSQIEKITQLNYNQFLRSVMLAQGEFAAFLSASGKDKGTLLEQITGEEIYKKIGEAINTKIFEEKKNLDSIKSKINNEDLLSDELRIELGKEQRLLSEKVNNLTKELKQAELIIAWYKVNSELNNEKIQLEKDEENLKKYNEDNKIIIEALKKHEQAEPYKNSIDDISRVEKEIIIKKLKFEELTNSLIIVENEIIISEEQERKCKELNENKENELRLWLPKLEKVTRLDSDIINSKKNKESKSISLYELSNSIKQIHKSVEENQQKISRFETDLIKIEKYLNENKNVVDIEKRLNDWNSNLTIRKSNKERIFDNSNFIKQKEKELTITKTNLENKDQVYDNEKDKLLKLKEDIVVADNALIISNIDELIKRQNIVNEKRNLWKEFQNISKNYIESKRKQNEYKTEKKKIENKKEELDEKINVLKIKVEESEKSLHDAEEILKLKSTIKSFEEERKKLEKGKACNLCGSIEHPYIVKYEEIKLSESNDEVKMRKDILKNYLNEEKNTELALARIKTESEHISTQIIINNEVIIESDKEFRQLNLKCDIDDSKTISSSISVIEIELIDISDQIINAQKLQNKKNDLVKQYDLELEKVNNLKNSITGLQEKSRNLEIEIQQKNEDLKSLTEKTHILEAELTNEFAEFELQLPRIDETNKFIESLETKISDFNTYSKKLVDINNTVSQTKIEISNNKKNIKEKESEETIYRNEINKLDKKLTEFISTRNAILPIDIKTEIKRTELQTDIEKSRLELENVSKSFQTLITKKATIEKEKSNVSKELSTQTNDIKIKLSNLGEKISESGFNSRSEIENSLLNNDDKSTYISVRKNIENTTLKLTTLKNKLSESFAKQEKEKAFETSENEANGECLTIRISIEDLLKREGEIKQQFELDNQIIERNKGVFEEISRQEKVLKKWTDLLMLLGGSKHAFNTYVQRLTLQNLIQLANVHLYKLNRRYSLKMNDTYKTGEELNFNLIDHYQTDEARLVDTSSGGEKFIISLALALGLSDLASNNVNIGSLFIDEGFGTLDNNTLEIVISTLETLQGQGKMIGIISHVENLKERIPTQIQVLKKSNGVSEVQVV